MKTSTAAHLMLLTTLTLTSSIALAEEVRDQPDLEVYGVAHVSLDSLSDGQASKLYLSSNSSRLGFRGGWALPINAEAIWRIEADASLDESGGQLASRNSYAGISSAIGALMLGRHDTAFEVLSDQVCLFRDQLGDARNIIGNQGAGWNRREDNVIAYQSPKLKGVSAFILHALSEGEDETHLTSMSVSFQTQSLLLTVAGELHGGGMTPVAQADASVRASDKSELGARAAARYTWRDLQLIGLYEMLNNVGGVSDEKSSAWGGAVAYTLSKAMLKAQYYASSGIDDASNSSKMIAVGVDYNLLESTRLYLDYAMTDNDTNAASSMSRAGRGDSSMSMVGDDPSGVSLGLVLKF